MVIDLMAAFLIFVVIAGSVMWVWDNKAADAENSIFENERFTMAEKTLDTLIRSKGLPENWETGAVENIQAVGIAKRDLVIDEAKADKFKDWSNNDYAVLRTKLLIGGNDYYFRILDPETVAMVFEAGTKPEGIITETTVRRPVIFTYNRESGEGKDEEGEESQHEAIAELTLYSTWQWRQ
jgi:hypothetical protein